MVTEVVCLELREEVPKEIVVRADLRTDHSIKQSCSPAPKSRWRIGENKKLVGSRISSHYGSSPQKERTGAFAFMMQGGSSNLRKERCELSHKIHEKNGTRANDTAQNRVRATARKEQCRGKTTPQQSKVRLVSRGSSARGPLLAAAPRCASAHAAACRRARGTRRSPTGPARAHTHKRSPPEDLSGTEPGGFARRLRETAVWRKHCPPTKPHRPLYTQPCDTHRVLPPGLAQASCRRQNRASRDASFESRHSHA
eukprot:6201154-Pleurochrysis_carterae.AAC.5